MNFIKKNNFLKLASYFLLASTTVVNATHVLVVDCDNRLRNATHCANGSLYGLIETVPPDNKFQALVDDLHPFVFRNPARGYPGTQHPFGGAIPVAERLSKTPGALVSVLLSDILPYWPYQWPGMDKWLEEVRKFILDKKASGLTNWYGLEIWNEAENTWRDSNGYTFIEMWKKTYDLIRELDPDVKIIGPCDGLYSEQRLRPFFEYCKKNNCLPDIMCWHELMGIELVTPRMKAYRKFEKEMGIPELPVTINEYCDIKHEFEGQPGSNARFIGKFERLKVDSALISWWFTPQPGHLGSLLATDTEKGAGWYFHKWYGDMTGDMLYVKPPNENSNLVDGAACIDSSQKYISFIFGGPNDGTINASFINLPDFIGDIAKVKFEKIDWISKDTVSSGPTTVFEKEYRVVDGQLAIIINNCNATSGYRIYITKGDGKSGSIEPPSKVTTLIIPDGTYKLINRHSGLALSLKNGSNAIQSADTNDKSQQWTISDDGGYRLLNVEAGKVLDVEGDSKNDGGNVIVWRDQSSFNQRWSIENTDDGYVVFINLSSGKVLDVEYESVSDGANIHQWTNRSAPNQQWKLVPVGDTKPLTTKTKTKITTTTTTQKTTPTFVAENSSCYESILKQGYKCCSPGCIIYYTDDDGTWGVEKGEWCGCPSVTSDSEKCSASILAQGYSCCKSNNCNVFAEDDDGRWGIENNAWCGISDSC
uniref:PR2455 n=1 Tax=Piromyces rhizinflatus TaxID=73428 RepID=A0A218MY48_9FUNG|nr:PR2455 [Piromyces rhizinflatus]